MVKQTTPTQQLKQYVNARLPIIAILSHEESRVMQTIHAAFDDKHLICEWSITTGLSNLSELRDMGATLANGDELPEEATAFSDPHFLLDFISHFDNNGEYRATLFVIKDLHTIVNGDDVTIKRYFREIAMHFEVRRHNILLVSPSFHVPDDLTKIITVMDFPLPTIEELDQLLRATETSLRTRSTPVTVDLDDDERAALVNAMRGLTLTEAKFTLKEAVVATKKLTIEALDFILDAKKQVIRKSGILEFMEADVTAEQVGGLRNLKNYANRMRYALSAKARELGIDAPKGVIFVGVPGTGKTLMAKAMTGGAMPVLKLDFGKVLAGGRVGDAEQNIREVWRIAKALAPVLLFIDEVEKGLADNSGKSDGGVMMRVIGTMLSEMQDNTLPIPVVATANDISGLRPEFIRRFDNVFFADLPTRAARADILHIHLSKRGYNVKITDDMLDLTYAYTGAEIEKAVKEAILTANFAERKLKPADIVDAIRLITPISKTMKENIANLREWVKNGRALRADDELEPAPKNLVASDGMLDNLEV